MGFCDKLGWIVLELAHERSEGFSLGSALTSHGLVATALLELVHARFVELLQVNVFESSNALLGSSTLVETHLLLSGNSSARREVELAYRRVRDAIAKTSSLYHEVCKVLLLKVCEVNDVAIDLLELISSVILTSTVPQAVVQLLSLLVVKRLILRLVKRDG